MAGKQLITALWKLIEHLYSVQWASKWPEQVALWRLVLRMVVPL